MDLVARVVDVLRHFALEIVMRSGRRRLQHLGVARYCAVLFQQGAQRGQSAGVSHMKRSQLRRGFRFDLVEQSNLEAGPVGDLAESCGGRMTSAARSFGRRSKGLHASVRQVDLSLVVA